MRTPPAVRRRTLEIPVFFERSELHRLQRAVQAPGQFGGDIVTGSGLAIRHDDAHDAGLADKIASGVPVKDG
ncbi:MAG: hypothetical protein AB7J19_06625, partial [Beijerinckiaceae bacterium]